MRPDNRYVYEVKLIHRLWDWDATLRFAADTAKNARKFALLKMADQDQWLIVSAKRVTA